MTNLCEVCDLPAAPHKPEECMEELVRKKKVADTMFTAAIQLVHKMGEPQDIKDKDVQQAVLKLDLETWRYAM